MSVGMYSEYKSFLDQFLLCLLLRLSLLILFFLHFSLILRLKIIINIQIFIRLNNHPSSSLQPLN